MVSWIIRDLDLEAFFCGLLVLDDSFYLCYLESVEDSGSYYQAGLRASPRFCHVTVS
jgi:hypothetical protein